MEFGAIERNLRQSFRIFANRPSGEVREYPGVTIAAAGVTFQMFNAAFLSAPVATEQELDRRIQMASVHFQVRGRDWAYWLCEAWLPERLRARVRHSMRNHQLRLSVEMPGMIAEQLNPPPPGLPALEVRPVRDPVVRNDFCAIGSVCFNVPLEWFQEVFSPDAVWEGFHGYVGYHQGEPVSTAATVIADGVAGVYNVATLPGHQRRGYGEAVMRHALDRAREQHGITRTILQSTAQGFDLYTRMGYRTATKIAVYAS